MERSSTPTDFAHRKRLPDGCSDATRVALDAEQQRCPRLSRGVDRRIENMEYLQSPIIGQIRLASELQGTAGGNWRNNCYRSPGCGKFFSANTIARFLLTLLALSPELSHCGAIEDGLPEVPNHILDFRRRIATGIRVHIPSWTSPNAGLKNSLPEMPVNPSTS